MTTSTKKLKTELTRKREPEPAPTQFLSTGCTLLNLALSGQRRGGFAVGHFSYLVGDSTSGKTFLLLTALAEAARDKRFDNYRFIFDQPEKGALMDIAHFFGAAVAKRLEPPQKNGEPSATIEDFYDHVDDAEKAGKPFIYLLDSMDALFSEAEDKKFDEQKAARRRGRAVVGSMGDGKAKKNSAGLRRVLRILQRTNSILVVISQTRDNIGFGAQFNPKTHAGGRAMKFYATVELWSSVREKIKPTINGKKRTVGIVCRVDTKKNRVTGRDRTVEFPIYHSVGIDDVEANINYLVEEGHWSETDGGVINAPDFRFKGKKPKLIQFIENGNHEIELQRAVASVWHDIEKACMVPRKRRYE